MNLCTKGRMLTNRYGKLKNTERRGIIEVLGQLMELVLALRVA